MNAVTTAEAKLEEFRQYLDKKVGKKGDITPAEFMVLRGLEIAVLCRRQEAEAGCKIPDLWIKLCFSGFYVPPKGFYDFWLRRIKFGK